MPADLPTTPEQWAAIVPNETDGLIAHEWYATCEDVPTGIHAIPRHLRVVALVAAASRIAEHERTKDVHAYRLAGYLSTLPGNTDKHPEEMLPEARRILEDRT